MNILHISPAGFISGGERSLLGLIRHLDPDKSKAIVAVPYKGAFSAELDKRGIPWIIFNHVKVRLINPFPYFKTLYNLIKVVKKKKIDLIHLNSSYALSCTPVGKLCGIPVVCHFRNAITPQIENRLFLKWTDKIIANSQFIRDHILNFCSEKQKVVTVLNGVDLKIFPQDFRRKEVRKKFGISQKDLLIGTIGQIVPHKGIHIFIKTAANILRQFSHASFLIIGEWLKDKESYRHEINFMIKELGLEEKIAFTGFRHDIPELLSAMDIVLLTPLQEPFGRVVIESMACSKAVVASAVGGIPEIIVDGVTGFLVPPGNSEEIAEKVIELAKNTDLAKKMGRLGRERVEKFFSMETHAQKIQNVYEELLKLS